MIWTKSVCGYFLSCCCVYLHRPGAWWIGVEWCSQVCNKPSIRDRSFITGLWWARRGLPRSVTSPGPLIGWPGRKLGCDWLLAGYQCPLSNNDGSLPDSLLSASLLPGIVLSAISRHPPLTPPPAPSSANFVPENTKTRHEKLNRFQSIISTYFGVFRGVQQLQIYKSIISWWTSRKVPLKESVDESDFNLFVYAGYYGPVFAKKIAHWGYRTFRQ